MTQIGKNIKKIRNVRSLSQQAFADLFQLTRGNISSYEEYRAEPKIEVILKIANYFGIPLNDFIEKELSVNELLHYNTKLVVETEKLKITQQLAKIPYIPTLYINDFIMQYQENDFLVKLPHIIVPIYSKSKLIAIEVDNPENLPAGLQYKSGDILIYEEIIRENIHRVTGKLGMLIDAEGMKHGIYREENDDIKLSLNSFVEYPFTMDASDKVYWVLKATYLQISQ